MEKTLIILLLTLLTPVTIGSNYYVAMNGSDTNNGSIDYPWHSIKASCYKLNPGDTLYIREGNYTGDNNTYVRFILHPLRASPDAPTTIKAYQNETVIIDALQPQDSDIRLPIFVIDSVENMIIDGLDLRNAGCGSTGEIDISYDSGSKNITIQNCRIGSGSRGGPTWTTNNPAQIWVHGGAENIIIRNNEIYNDEMGQGSGIKIQNALNVLIENCEFYQLEAGIGNKYGDAASTGHIYRNNFFHDIGPSRAGIWATSPETLIENNLIIDSLGAGIEVFNGETYEYGNEPTITHNTIYNCTMGISIGGDYSGDATENATIINNIMVSSTSYALKVNPYYSAGEPSLKNSNNNMIYRIDSSIFAHDYDGTYTFDTWKQSYTSFDTESYYESPEFIDVSGNLNEIDDFVVNGGNSSGNADDGEDIGADISCIGINAICAETNHDEVICEADNITECFYVDNFTNGNCSYISPCNTSYALSQMNAGDYLYYMNGTYKDYYQNYAKRAIINIDNYFSFQSPLPTKENPVVFKPYPGENVTFFGDGIDPCIEIESESNMVFENFRFDRCIIHIGENGAANNIIIRNNSFFNHTPGDNSGAVMVGYCENVSILNNLIIGPGLGSEGIHHNTNGLYISRDLPHLRVYNNEISNVPIGIYYKHANDIANGDIDMRIGFNYIHDTDRTGMRLNSNYARVHDNLMGANNVGGGIYVNMANGVPGGDYNRITHNTFYDCSLTLSEETQDGYFPEGAYSNLVRDNVFQNTTYIHSYSTMAHDTELDYNLYSNTAIRNNRIDYNLEQWKTFYNQDNHSLSGSPTFVGGANPTTISGFALAPGSAGKNAGTNGSDMGANISQVGIQRGNDVEEYHEADTNEDGTIDSHELRDFVKLWKNGMVRIDEILEAIGIWK